MNQDAYRAAFISAFDRRAAVLGEETITAQDNYRLIAGEWVLVGRWRMEEGWQRTARRSSKRLEAK